MWIRWKRRYRNAKGQAGKVGIDCHPLVTFSATVVESQRIDGKHHQHFIRTIASIHEEDIGDMLIHRWFWQIVHREFDSMDLDPAQRSTFEASIAAKVHQPSDAEVEAVLPAPPSPLFRNTWREFYGLAQT